MSHFIWLQFVMCKLACMLNLNEAKRGQESDSSWRSSKSQLYAYCMQQYSVKADTVRTKSKKQKHVFQNAPILWSSYPVHLESKLLGYVSEKITVWLKMNKNGSVNTVIFDYGST